jgi:hypothetical protein
MFNDLTEVYPGLERAQMRAARLPGSGATRRTMLQELFVGHAPLAGDRAGLMATESVSYVTIQAGERGRAAWVRTPWLRRDGVPRRPPPRAEPGEQLWLRPPPEQCRWYDPETHLLLEAKE